MKGKGGKRTPTTFKVNTPACEGAPESGKKPLRPAQCRGHIRRELAANFRGVVDALVENARAGSFQHVKLVVELLDVRPGEKEKARRKGPGPLTRMLREMERRDAEKKQALSSVD